MSLFKEPLRKTCIFWQIPISPTRKRSFNHGSGNWSCLRRGIWTKHVGTLHVLVRGWIKNHGEWWSATKTWTLIAQRRDWTKICSSQGGYNEQLKKPNLVFLDSVCSSGTAIASTVLLVSMLNNAKPDASCRDLLRQQGYLIAVFWLNCLEHQLHQALCIVLSGWV